MNYRVALSARAERDRDAAFSWYAENYSPEFAARWYNGLTQAIQSLGRDPLRCGVAHEDDKFSFELRELLFWGRQHKHRVLFTVQDDVVAVLHIRHSARRDLTRSDLSSRALVAHLQPPIKSGKWGKFAEAIGQSTVYQERKVETCHDPESLRSKARR
jgi:plasmid stabilization system protein ParE